MKKVASTRGLFVHLVVAVEYTDCISAEELDSPNKCPGCDTKQSNGKAAVMLELWGMWSTPSLPSLLGPLWPGVVLQTNDLWIELFEIELFDHLTVCKKMTDV